MKYKLCILLLFTAHVFCAGKSILIYQGPGVSEESLRQTELSVKSLFSSVEFITPEQVVHDSWEEKAALFILPGGADLPYVQSLNGAGNQKIRKYVEEGGAFLGICAGSYYGGSFVEFAKGTVLEVQGERELAFFPGVVKGPVLAPYDYLSHSGARAARLISENGELFTVFYNGGGYFVEPESYSNVSVLATYDATERHAAIIRCQVGRGIAILSGPHFEYDPSLLDVGDPHLQRILPSLIEGNERRKQLLLNLIAMCVER